MVVYVVVCVDEVVVVFDVIWCGSGFGGLGCSCG